MNTHKLDNVDKPAKVVFSLAKLAQMNVPFSDECAFASKITI